MHVSRAEEVSQVYMDAARRGVPPTKAVMEHFEVPRSTAGRWVLLVRALGLIPPTSKGRSPRRNPKIVTVAKALGVSPIALETALRDHAGGDLRLSR